MWDSKAKKISQVQHLVFKAKIAPTIKGLQVQHLVFEAKIAPTIKGYIYIYILRGFGKLIIAFLTYKIPLI